MPELVTLGETMVAFVPHSNGPLRYSTDFKKKLAGSESNVAIGVRRLGHSAGWISRLGLDEFGLYIEKEIKGEGVDTSQVVFDEKAPTGVMFKEIKSQDITNVYYYRKNSAASNLKIEDINEEYIKISKILHLTGITPVLSEDCLETVNHVINLAKKNGVQISFDPNIRFKLWDVDKAKQVLNPILENVDILLCGLEEGQFLLDCEKPEEIINKAFELGIKKVAVKLGSKGAMVASNLDKDKIYFIEPVKVEVVDSVGAGDAFAAGFLSGELSGKTIKECGELGAIMGAYAVTTKGDYEGLPGIRDLDNNMKKNHITR